jgi:hypothetical protein
MPSIDTKNNYIADDLWYAIQGTKDLLSETINSFRLFDILKLWEAVHLPQ